MTKRVIISEAPFGEISHDYWAHNGDWPVKWVDHPERPLGEPSVALFRLPFVVEKATTVRIHVTADNRYHLMLDGEPVGRGPERGDPAHWYFESYDLELEPGDHMLVAMTWWLGDNAAQAQMSVRPGFLLATEGPWMERLSTGLAPWEAALVPGITSLSVHCRGGATGGRVRIDGAQYPWGWETGTVGDWQPVTELVIGMSAALKRQHPVPTWLLTPATLPPMREELAPAGTLRYLVDTEDAYPVDSSRHLDNEAAQWQAWLNGEDTITIPANVTRRALVDLGQYTCAYPALKIFGGNGSSIRLYWDEALYEDRATHAKGHRGEIEGKTFIGAGDEFLADGSEHRTFGALWWMSGRYVELAIKTGDEPLTLEALELCETGYPLSWEGGFASSDERLAEVIPIGLRALQMCAHETYMDCPYYEQLMYVGDTRLEVLVTYATTSDDRLPRKAIEMFDASRMISGITRSQYPSRYVQIIPPFSLWWVGMVHDFWQWRNDTSLVRRMIPGVRSVTEAFRMLLRNDGLIDPPSGWNFTDWVPEWKNGIPPYGHEQPSGILNLHFALALLYKADLEAFFGEEMLATRDRETAMQLVESVLTYYWNEERGLIADALDQQHFSEHAQCLAILTGLLPPDKEQRIIEGLLHDEHLSRMTIYFSHYLFETLYKIGRMDAAFDRLALWFELKANGFTTTFESPEPCRSDCHAWGAHPIYHYYASILGIRPADGGFRHVRIAPALGPLTWAEGTMPHPDGDLTVSVRREGDALTANITLPPGITGELVWGGKEYTLSAGTQELTVG